MQTATVHYSQTGYVASHPSKATIFVTESVILQHDNAPPHSLVVCASGRVDVQPHSVAGIYVFSGFRAAIDLRLC